EISRAINIITAKKTHPMSKFVDSQGRRLWASTSPGWDIRVSITSTSESLRTLTLGTWAGMRMSAPGREIVATGACDGRSLPGARERALVLVVGSIRGRKRRVSASSSSGSGAVIGTGGWLDGRGGAVMAGKGPG